MNSNRTWRHRITATILMQAPPATVETGAGERSIETCFYRIYFFKLCVLDNSLFV